MPSSNTNQSITETHQYGTTGTRIATGPNICNPGKPDTFKDNKKLVHQRTNKTHRHTPAENNMNPNRERSQQVPPKTFHQSSNPCLNWPKGKESKNKKTP
mmetsp:Transcript_27611/g.47670  ORF Transcript_27611/g.47670 Transcript_27611/m.47670 type:complete len:100 (+) Transcript_27611:692-991(+)